MVWRRRFLGRVGVMSIGFMSEDRSRSSLLSNCTSGLVGGFKTKLEERDEDIDGFRYRTPNEFTSSVDAKCESFWNGE